MELKLRKFLQCPRCGGAAHSGDYLADRESIWWDATCGDCGLSWQDLYVYHSSVEFTDADGSDVTTTDGFEYA